MSGLDARFWRPVAAVVRASRYRLTLACSTPLIASAPAEPGTLRYCSTHGGCRVAESVAEPDGHVIVRCPDGHEQSWDEDDARSGEPFLCERCYAAVRPPCNPC